MISTQNDGVGHRIERMKVFGQDSSAKLSRVSAMIACVWAVDSASWWMMSSQRRE